jgi:hypothetical protein
LVGGSAAGCATEFMQDMADRPANQVGALIDAREAPVKGRP